MHPGALEFVARFATSDAVSVIEIGSRQVLDQPKIRELFPAAKWTGIDPIAGPCVDVVCNALDYYPSECVDLVICCEVFEHCEQWPYLIATAHRWLMPGGRLLVTCAGIGRPIHSAIDGGDVLHFGEWYKNVSERRLSEAMQLAGFTQIEVSGNEHWHDTYAAAIR